MSKSKAVFLATTGLALFGLMASVGVAVAEPGGDAPPVEVPTTTLRDSVTDTVEPLANLYSKEGFGRTEVSYEPARVTVYWKGSPPPEINSAVESAPEGVDVIVRQVPYSQSDFDLASSLIFEASPTSPDGAPTVSATVPWKNMDGLTVEMVASELPAARGQFLSSTEQEFEELTGLPVNVRSAPEPELLTRQNDSAPWQGGGAIADRTGDDYCSTGFAVVTPGGVGRLLSAGHCSATGRIIRDGVGDRIGTVIDMAPNRDALLIDAESPSGVASTIGKAFGGAWNASPSAPRYQSFVGGAAPPSQGEIVCTSGARTGEQCNRRITDVGVGFPCWRDLQRDCTGFRLTGDGASGGRGDSGGPIYIRRDDGRVGARGIIQTGRNPMDQCGQTTAEPTVCFRVVFSVGIQTLLDRFNVRIEQ